MKDPAIQLWCEDEVHFQRYSSLMRMWAPQGAATSCPLCLDPREGRLLWSGQPENGSPCYQRCSHLQQRDFWRLSRLSSPRYPREDLSDSGQRQVAQSKSLERFFHPEPGSSGADFSATLFARTQPGRAGMENYPQARHPQPLFPFGRRTQDGSDFSFYEVVATK